MNFANFRFYNCVPDALGDFVCHRIVSENFKRVQNARIIIIEKSFPEFLDKFRIMFQLYPMNVKIKSYR